MFIGLVTAVAASACYGTGSVLQALGAKRSAAREAAAGETVAAEPARSDGTAEGLGAFGAPAVVGAVRGGGVAGVAEKEAATGYGGPSLASTAKAVATWEFMAGTVLDAVGFALGALSAKLLPLFLSQTVISANLVVTALLGIRVLGVRLVRPEWVSVGVVCGALVLLAGAAGHEGAGHVAMAAHWGLLAVSALLVAVGLPILRVLGQRAAIPAGLLSGLGFGAVGVGVRMLNGTHPFDAGALIGDPALYAIVVAGVGGMYFHTVALQIGSINGATAALVVGETVVPGILGVLWLGDTSRPGFAWAAIAGFVLAVAGAVAVAWYGNPAPGEAEPAGDPHPAAPSGAARRTTSPHAARQAVSEQPAAPGAPRPGQEGVPPSESGITRNVVPGSRPPQPPDEYR